MREETLIVSYDREQELRDLARQFPESRIIIESNRKAAETFIRSQSAQNIDLDGLAHVYKEFNKSFKLNRENDLRPFLTDLYEQYDKKYPK